LLAGTQMASTLKTIAIHSPITPAQLDNSRIPVLISSAGKSLRSLDLHLGNDDALRVREGGRVIDLHKLTSLQHLCLRMPVALPSLHGVDMALPWVCRQLAGYQMSSTALRSITLRVPLIVRSNEATYAYAAQVGLNAPNCQLLDHTLSAPPFMSLEEVLLRIAAYNLPTTGIAKLQQWLPTQFPKLAARGTLRVLVSGGERD